MATFNGGLGIDNCYYQATSNPPPTTPPLNGSMKADVVIIGGGCTGLAAALALAEAGKSVVCWKGGRTGWGSSGRNCGQIITGLRKGAADLVRLYGRKQAQRILISRLLPATNLQGLSNVKRFNAISDARAT